MSVEGALNFTGREKGCSRGPWDAWLPAAVEPPFVTSFWALRIESDYVRERRFI